MKRILVVALICVNVALLLALLLVAASPQAGAQVVGGGSDYIMMTGQIGADWDAIYVIDLGNRRLAAWRFDKTRKRLVPFRGRELRRDFGRSR